MRIRTAIRALPANRDRRPRPRIATRDPRILCASIRPMRSAGPPVRRGVARAAAAVGNRLSCFVGLLSRAVPRALEPARARPPAPPDDSTGARDVRRLPRFPPPDILPRDAWRDEFVRMMFIRENRLPPIGPPRHVVSQRAACRPTWSRCSPFYTEPRARAAAGAGAWPAPAAIAGVVHAPRADHAGHAGHAGGVARAPRRPRWRRAARPARHRHAPGARLQRHARRRPSGALAVAREHPAPGARHARRRRQATASRICSSPTWASSSRPITTRARSIWLRGLANGKFGAFWLDGWPRVAERRGRRLQRRRQERSRGRGVRLAQDRAGRDSREPHRPTRRSRSFSTHTIDPRAGSIHVIPVDLNRDGKMDFVTLLAQEHETVLAYINTGTATSPSSRR